MLFRSPLFLTPKHSHVCFSQIRMSIFIRNRCACLKWRRRHTHALAHTHTHTHALTHTHNILSSLIDNLLECIFLEYFFFRKIVFQRNDRISIRVFVSSTVRSNSSFDRQCPVWQMRLKTQGHTVQKRALQRGIASSSYKVTIIDFWGVIKFKISF